MILITLDSHCKWVAVVSLNPTIIKGWFSMKQLKICNVKMIKGELRLFEGSKTKI